MHVDTGPGQIAGDDLFEGIVQYLALGGVQRHLAVLGHVPLGEQLQFAPQQRTVVGWQHTLARGLLPLHQGLHRIQVQGQWRRLCGVNHLHHGLVTQVAQQHEAVGLIPGQHLGGFQSSVLHQAGHVHKRLAVFLVGRGVHDDQAGAGRVVHAQVAAKTRIGRGQAHGIRLQSVHGLQAGEPGRKQGLALRVAPQGSGWG